MRDLTSQQEEVLIGVLLGDGYLEEHHEGDYGSRLQIKQRASRKDYVIWLYEMYKNFCLTKPQLRKDYDQWYFATRYVNVFNKYRSEFYDKGGRKKIPRRIKGLLKSSLSLAVWYMDDGYLDFRPKSHYAYYLAVDCFRRREAEKLAMILKSNFSIKASVHFTLNRGKRYPQLYIGAESRDRFLQLIKSHVLSCFSHKLPPFIA